MNEVKGPWLTLPGFSGRRGNGWGGDTDPLSEGQEEQQGGVLVSIAVHTRAHSPTAFLFSYFLESFQTLVCGEGAISPALSQQGQFGPLRLRVRSSIIRVPQGGSKAGLPGRTVGEQVPLALFWPTLSRTL